MENVLRRVLKHFFEDFIDGLDGAIDYSRSDVKLRDLKMKKDVWQEVFCDEDDMCQISDCSIGDLHIEMQSLGVFKIVANQVTFDISVVVENVAKALLPDLRQVQHRLHRLRPRALDDAIRRGAHAVNKNMEQLSKFNYTGDLLAEYAAGSGYDEHDVKHAPTTQEQELSRALIGLADMTRDEAKPKFPELKEPEAYKDAYLYRSSMINGDLSRPDSNYGNYACDSKDVSRQTSRSDMVRDDSAYCPVCGQSLNGSMRYRSKKPCVNYNNFDDDPAEWIGLEEDPGFEKGFEMEQPRRMSGEPIRTFLPPAQISGDYGEASFLIPAPEPGTGGRAVEVHVPVPPPDMGQYSIPPGSAATVAGHGTRSDAQAQRWSNQQSAYTPRPGQPPISAAAVWS